MTPFAKQTTLLAEPARPGSSGRGSGRVGRYVVDVDPRWNCPVVPQGGMMVAIAAKAMAVELAEPDQRLRSLTTVFAGQVPSGPVAIDVSVLRRGRSISQARADVRSPGGGVGHTTVAVFGRSRPGFEFTDLHMPAVPPPDECPSFRDPLPPEAGELERRPPFAFWENVEGRPALGHPPWEDYVPASSDCACWYRFDEPPMLADGTLDPLAVVALCDLMPSSVGERMGPGQPDWLPPSADLTVHLLAEARSEWLLGHLRARWAGDGYASVEMATWDQTGQLVAHAAQIMILTFPDGPPAPEQRVPLDHRG